MRARCVIGSGGPHVVRTEQTDTCPEPSGGKYCTSTGAPEKLVEDFQKKN